MRHFNNIVDKCEIVTLSATTWSDYRIWKHRGLLEARRNLLQTLKLNIFIGECKFLYTKCEKNIHKYYTVKNMI